MQVCNSLQTDNHASTPPLNFLQAEYPSCHPTDSVEALKEILNSPKLVANDKKNQRKQINCNVLLDSNAED